MTFLLSHDVGTTSTVIFAILVVIASMCAFGTARIAHSKHHYHQVRTVRYLLPLVCIIFAVENLFLASKKWFFNSEFNENNIYQKVLIYILFVLQATGVPILLLVIFDVCYLIHKRRSVNFCGMFFDEGHRVIRVSSVMRSAVCRNLIRIVAFALFVSGLVINFGDSDQIKQAGKTGWFKLFEKNFKAYEEPYLILSFVPEGVLILCSLYLGAILWRYGSASSIVVHSSFFNPWCYLFFASIINICTQFFSLGIYPLTSNIGYIVFIISILMLLIEIDKDMDHAEDFANFLSQIKKLPEEDIDYENNHDDRDIQPGDENKDKENSPNDTNIEMGNIPDNLKEGTEMISNEEMDKTLRASGNSLAN